MASFKITLAMKDFFNGEINGEKIKRRICGVLG